MAKSFVSATRNGQPYLGSYDGMDQATITNLAIQLGCTNIQFVTQAQYDTLVLANQPVPPTSAETLALERTQAIGELTGGAQPLSKLQRAVLLVILDEVNVIRGLLSPAQAARTIAQFKNAVQAKINSGAAD